MEVEMTGNGIEESQLEGGGAETVVRPADVETLLGGFPVVVDLPVAWGRWTPWDTSTASSSSATSRPRASPTSTDWAHRWRAWGRLSVGGFLPPSLVATGRR